MSGFILGHDVLRDATPVSELGIAVLPGPSRIALGRSRSEVGSGSAFGADRVARRERRPVPVRVRSLDNRDHALDGGMEVLGVRGAKVEGVAVAVVGEADPLPRLDIFAGFFTALFARQQRHRRLGHGTLFLCGS